MTNESFRSQSLDVNEIERRIIGSSEFKLFSFKDSRKKPIHKGWKGVTVKTADGYKPSLANYIYITSNNIQNSTSSRLQIQMLERLLGQASSVTKKDGRTLFVARYDYSAEGKEEVEKTFIYYLVSEK